MIERKLGLKLQTHQHKIDNRLFSPIFQKHKNGLDIVNYNSYLRTVSTST